MKKWIGLDGEGLGRNPHRYVMLARSDIRGNSAIVQAKRGLTTQECLDFILAIPKETRVCGYYLGYDWTMILRDLPDVSIYRLLRPELRVLPAEEGGGFSYIRWGDYRLHYLAGMFRVSRKGRATTVWDIGKFFQAPFVDAIEAWEVPAPLADIKKMKDQRAIFSEDDRDRIKAYCLSECRALAELATNLESAHIDVGITPKTWHGPGSTAGALMKSLEIQDKRGAPPKELEYAADCAFFGGRFEQSNIGLFKDVYGYDIISAYPYQAFKLPCLQHGRWRRTKRAQDIVKACAACVRYRIRDIGHKEVWGPLPCRLRNGAIVFPRGGASGWVWRDEYLIASQHWDGVEFGGEAWVLSNDCDCQPFAELMRLFRERILLGKSGKGRITKLALNSVYGKLAQTVGNPPYASRIWAGIITSGTRAQLMSLLIAHTDRRNVLALATDGLYSRERIILPSPPLTPDTLGAWESDDPKDMVFVRPGIYWAENGETVRARGLGRKLLDPNRGDEKQRQRILEQRANVIDAIECDDKRVIVGESELFGGARACVYKLPSGKYKRSKHYGQWHSIPARVSLDPGPKRAPNWALHLLPGVESMPYSKAPLSDDAKTLKMIDDVFWAMRG